MKAALLLCAIAGASAQYASKLHCMDVRLRPGTSGGPTAQITGENWKNELPKSLGVYATKHVTDTKLCVSHKGQHCDIIQDFECKLDNGKWQIGNNCANVDSVRYLVRTQRGPKIAVTKQQLQAVIGQTRICYHFPEDNLFTSNKCSLRLNFVKPNGHVWSWTVDGGKHNVPHVDGLIDSMVLVGKGCMAIRYSAQNQKGTSTPMSEGYYAQPANGVRSVTVLAPKPIICGAGTMATKSGGKDKCIPCPSGTSSMPGDNICTPLKTCSSIKCYHVKKGVTYKQCDDSKYTHLEEGVDGLSYSYASRGRCHTALSDGFTHVFHHGREKNGKHHVCKTNKQTGKCSCGCYDGALGDASRYCKPGFANPDACFIKQNGGVTHCKGTTWFNEKTDKCESCPEYATCKNGVVKMQTVRTTAKGNKYDSRTFHIPKQMGYDRCKISVKARQTDYGNNGQNYPYWDERLIIRHKDVNVKLHQNCGFKHQCYTDLYTCKIDKSEEMVTIDHGTPDHITIQGENGKGVDYCPFNPKTDLSGKVDFANGHYGVEHVAESSQTSGSCGKYGMGSNCYHMWAQVSIDCCCKGKSCKC